MLVIGSFVVWWIAALGFAVTFESCYPLWRRDAAHRPAKPDTAQAYWCIVCLLSFVIGATPLAPLAVFPIALSHFDLTRHTGTRIGGGTIVRNIPRATNGLLNKVFK